MRHTLLLSCLLALAAGAAQAQSQAPNNSAQLHADLRLTAAQEPAWQTFQAGVAPSPERRARARQAAAMLPYIPTPRRLALTRAQMQSDLTEFDRTARAVEAFYATLTPDQQKTFDRETAPSGQQQLQRR